MATIHLSGDSPTSRPGAAHGLPPVGPVRRALALFAVLMTLPYLVLKVGWLTGSRAGLTDPEFGTSTAMLVLNALTAGLDVVALVLAVVLLTRRGIRAPTWLVLPPMWIGAGLLGQILLTLPVALVAQTVSPAQTGSGEVPPIAGWVYTMVYAGFSGLGVGLLGAFSIYAWQRWGTRPVPPAGRAARHALLLGATLALGSGAVHLVLSDVPLLNRLLDLGISGGTATALAVLAVPRSVVPTRLAVVLAFVGTGALAAWGSYVAVVTGLPNEQLGQILLTLPVALVAQTVSPAQTGSGEVPPIAGWVYTMVYAGFAGLGVGLLGAFSIYAWQRWGTRPVPPAGRAARHALLLGATLALGSGAVHLVLSDVPLLNRLLDLGISGGTATALAVLAVPRSVVPTRLAVVLAFVGTGALAAWGSYVAVVTGVPNELVGQTEVDWGTVGASVFRLGAGLVGAGALALRLRRPPQPEPEPEPRPQTTSITGTITIL